MASRPKPSPTLEQMLILVGRARAGLTPEEAAVLHAGITGLDAARRSVGGLQAALHAARRERDTALAELEQQRTTAAQRAHEGR
ncbi:hypothetical protein [Streptomyces sp. NPDC051173]|uniref:hypothetical protein n=1 Tax=Streptomyces sp. NPDC051173 TaxID=3155164 RepID=UPI00344B68C4